MKALWIPALATLALAAIATTTPQTADARISCSHRYGCVEGKYTSKPLAGMFCRSVIRKRPGYRTHFFCTTA